ncbi:WD40 repeat domain-containing protein [Nonomuraea guangzhouensis]|uniref:WD40 repeat domain-containing protein n=1 Tax=Nonomuraea guangzhouensis TaxID=1291555 RepID=A0ABW4GM80_9ACTN|nr:WD40 repeat domain-containing protein [Nonomuraea guangzhouensis]
MSHVRYRLTGMSFPGAVDLTVPADGRARLEHARASGLRAWTAELDRAVWPWLLDALRASGFPEVAAPAPVPGSTLRELSMIDGELTGSVLFGWDDGGELGLEPALRILDALVHQVSGGAVRETANELPRLAHRSAPDPTLPPPDPGSPAAAAFGTVGGLPAYALSRPGRTFALYGLPYEEELGAATVTDAPTRAIALGAAGGREIVATGGDDLVIRVWDTGTGQQLHAAAGHDGPVLAVTAAGGLIYTGGADGVLRVWDAAGSLGSLADRHEGAINAVRAHGTLLVAGSDDGMVRLTDLSNGRTLHSLYGHEGWVNAVATGDGLVASAGADRLVRIWDAGTGQELRALEGHSSSVTGLVFLTVAGRPALASCALDGRVTIHDPHTGTLLAEWRSGDWAADITTAAPQGSATTASAAAPERLVTAGDGVRVWAVDGTLVRELTDSVADAVATDGTLLAAGSPDGTLRSWRPADGFRPRASADGGTTAPSDSIPAAPTDGGITSLAFDGGSLVCGTGSGTVRVHDPVGGVVAVPTPHTGQVLALALDGDLLVSGGMDGTVRTWDATSGRPLRRLTAHTAGVTCVATGRSGDRVVIASSGYDRVLRTWDAATGRPLSAVHGHPLPVYALAFGTVGGRAVLASGSYDGLVPVRDAETGEDVVVLGGNPGTVRCLRFLGPDVLAVGCDDGTVRLWHLPDGVQAGETRLGAVPLALSGDLYAVTQNGLSRLTPPEPHPATPP